jgi:4-amino-4-deoxy-L-arabinose transferase-like glycosyltransferase
MLALLIGLALTAGGLALSWPLPTGWSEGGLTRFYIFILGAAGCVALLARRLRWNVYLAAALCALLLAAMAGALAALLVAVWMLLASALLGNWLARALRCEGSDWVSQLLAGAGCYASAVGLLAHYPVNYRYLYVLALALPLVLGRRTLQRWFGLAASWAERRRRPGGGDDIALDLAIAVVALTHLIVGLLPELGFDALVTHLFVPAHLATRHQWGFDVSTYVWAVMPMLGDWIFSIAYMLGGETAARLSNVSFVLLLGWLVRELVRWSGGTARSARWAVLLFLSTPLTFTESSSLFIEAVWTCFVLAGTLALLKACSDAGRERRQLLLAGLFLGCALAAKAVTFMVLPPLVLIFIWRWRTWRQAGMAAPLLLAVALLLLFGASPYATAWWATGNPVFPFFNKLFQSPLWRPENFEPPAMFGKGVTWDILYRATFHSEKYVEGRAGAAGFQWLLLFVPAVLSVFLLRRSRGLALFMVGAASVALTFHSTAYLRYVFPAYAMFAALIGLGMGANAPAGSARASLWSAVAAVAVCLNLLFLNAAAFHGDFNLRTLLSQSERDAYLAKRLPLRNAVGVVNGLNSKRAPVVVLAQPHAAGLESDALYVSWYNIGFETAMNAARTEQAMAMVLIEHGVDFLIIDANWEGPKEARELAAKVSEPVAEWGRVTARRLKAEYRFGLEMLVNPDLRGDKGWDLMGDALLNVEQGTLLVSVASPAMQLVPVKAGQQYKNAAVARCRDSGGVGRLQVNWNDAKGRFIGTSIDTFDCTAEWSEHRADVVAPPGAASAVVYVSAHTAVPLEFKQVSFRR